MEFTLDLMIIQYFFRLKVKYILGLWKEDYENCRNLEKNRQKLWVHGKLEWNRGISTLHFQMTENNYLLLTELLMLIIAWYFILFNLEIYNLENYISKNIMDD